MRIEAAAKAAGVTLAWKPFLLGPIFAAQGWNDSPFNVYPVKGRYMWRDLERICAAHDLPLRRPSQFPRNGLLAARIALLGADRRWGPDFVRAVYRANFADDRNIADAAVVSQLLGALGLEAAVILEAATSPENKQRLKEQEDRAIELGLFGAPSFVSRGELFWGHDRLDDALEWHRAGERT